MPRLTFTADSTTNQLTIASHNFTNGDGPVTPYTLAGTLPTGSPAITAGTDYWVKVDDSSHVKLATSQANALAGTTIDILTNGSGTLELLYDIPFRRPATVTPGSQVKSRFFNQQAGDAQNRIGLFDFAIALSNLLLGQAQSVYTAFVLAVAATFNAAVTFAQGAVASVNQHFTVSGTGKYKRGARVRPIPLFSSNGGKYTEQSNTTMVFPGNNIAEFHVQVEDGERITQIQARVACGAVGAVTMKLFKIDHTGTSATTQIGSSASNTGNTNVNETLTISGLTEDVGTGFVHYMVDFTMNNAGPVVLKAAWSTTTIP